MQIHMVGLLRCAWVAFHMVWSRYSGVDNHGCMTCPTLVIQPSRSRPHTKMKCKFHSFPHPRTPPPRLTLTFQSRLRPCGIFSRDRPRFYGRSGDCPLTRRWLWSPALGGFVTGAVRLEARKTPAYASERGRT